MREGRLSTVGVITGGTQSNFNHSEVRSQDRRASPAPVLCSTENMQKPQHYAGRNSDQCHSEDVTVQELRGGVRKTQVRASLAVATLGTARRTLLKPYRPAECSVDPRRKHAKTRSPQSSGAPR